MGNSGHREAPARLRYTKPLLLTGALLLVLGTGALYVEKLNASASIFRYSRETKVAIKEYRARQDKWPTSIEELASGLTRDDEALAEYLLRSGDRRGAELRVTSGATDREFAATIEFHGLFSEDRPITIP